jgi:hypothetical protein
MLVTISWNIRFGTVEAIPNRHIGTLVSGIKSVATVYKRTGFHITTALMDGEFELMRGDLADLGIALNKAAHDEYVGDVERFIRTLKECMHAIYNTLPFTNMPPRLVIEMAKHAVYWWLNTFPHPDGVSDTLSPQTIVTGQTVDYNRHCKYEFGQYIQSHEQHNNSMAPRTIGALAMRPMGNAQGNYYFFSLSTGRIINRAHATKLPMPDDVISCVHVLAQQQKATPGLVFSDRNRHINDEDDNSDDDDDSDFVPDNDDDESMDPNEYPDDESSDDSTYYPPNDTEEDSDTDNDDGRNPGVNYDVDDNYEDEADDDADDDYDNEANDPAADEDDVKDEPLQKLQEWAPKKTVRMSPLWRLQEWNHLMMKISTVNQHSSMK